MPKDDEKDHMQATPADRVTGHLDDWEDLAIDYMDGQVDQETKAAIVAHLDSCAACASRLGVQHAVSNLLEQAALEDSPADLEDRVLGEILFPREPARDVSRSAAKKLSWWSVSWQRRFKAWIPATVAVVALLAAVISYGVIRGDQNSATTTAAPRVASASATVTETETAADGSGERYSTEKAAGSGVTSTTTAGATTSASPMTTAAGAVATNAGVSTTTTTTGMLAAGTQDTFGPAAAAGPTTTAPSLGVHTPETIQDKKLMVAELKSTGSPVYFVFEPTAPATGEEAAAQTSTDFAQLVTQLTGLQPLTGSLSLQGTTFGAYVPRNQAAQLVDLLRSIGATLNLTLDMASAPIGTAQPETGDEFAALLRQHAAEIPEMSATRTPQPAVSDWTFTTSTLLPGKEASAPPANWEAPDQAGTHILVVIYLGV